MSDLLLPELRAETGDSFLTFLSPWRENDGLAAWPRGWLFRGQAHDWPLLPPALRPDASKLASLTSTPINTIEAKWVAERDVLVDFFEIADQRGLALPDDSQHLRNLVETLASKRGDVNIRGGIREWIENNDLLSLMALAQHYGVPTRLLDWSRSAMIAAFFAAEGAANDSNAINADDRMVVWAFYFPEFGRHDVVVKDSDPVRIVTAPTASNPNLRAQQGVFTLLGSNTLTDDDGNYLPMDQALDRQFKKSSSSSESLIMRCKMQKISVHRRETLPILRRLAQLDITPSAVYPGYRSIVDDLRLRVLYSDIWLNTQVGAAELTFQRSAQQTRCVI